MRSALTWMVGLVLLGCGPPDGSGPSDAGSSDDASAVDANMSSPPDPPAAITASDGTSANAVEVRWDASDGASGYRVWRDGVAIAEVTSQAFDDDGASGGGVPPPPTGVVASQDLVDRIEVSWSRPTAAAGATHTYTVTAFNSAGESSFGQGDGGFRAAFPITSYELAVDGGAFTDVGDVDTYADLSAPSRVIVPGVAAASKGDSLAFVALSLAGTTTTPAAERSYAIRGINAAGAGEASDPVFGLRPIDGSGAISYQWQRSLLDADIDYTDIPGATMEHDIDTMASTSGPHWYRCRISAAGATDAVSTPARGWLPDDSTTPDPDFWITNSSVSTVVPTPDAIILAGNFTYLGPAVGNGAATSLVDGTVDTSGATIDYWDVAAVISDGAGGFYVGGGFLYVDGVGIGSLIRVNASGEVDPTFAPSASYAGISALALDDGVLYVGGVFGIFGGEVRSHLAAVDATTGAVLPWNPDASAPVIALAAANGIVYAGGEFTDIGGQASSHLAAIDAVTGIPAAWPGTDTKVRSLALRGGTLYVGGGFSQAGGASRERVAAIDIATGLATAWNPNIGPNNPGTSVDAIVAGDTAIYVGGNFASVGAIPRGRLAAINPMTGTATAWDPAMTLNGSSTFISTLALAGSTLYAGGGFKEIGGAPRNNAAALDVSTGLATGWNPTAAKPVSTIAVGPTSIYLGGNFNSLGGVNRYTLAILDRSTGQPTAWNPSGGAVTTVAVIGSTLYVGGAFLEMAGQARNRLAAFDLTTGALLPWNPDADATVWLLAADGDTLYLSGDFTRIGTSVRNRLAEVDPITGVPTDWNPDLNGRASVIAVHDDRVYVGGAFTQVGAQPRNHIAAIDRVTGSPTAWNPDADDRVRTLAFANGVIYAGGEFRSIGGQARDYVAALDPGTGAATLWDPDADSWVRALQPSGDAIYVGGDFGSIGGQYRPRLAVVAASSGRAASWTPDPGSSVNKVVVDGAGLLVGGGFSIVKAQPREGLAVYR